jgi:c-di-GMP-binding flagellar brake protein YcgR
MTHVDTETAPESVTRLPFKSLGMRTGMALQTRRLVEGASKKESQFFGAIESKGVMVGPMGPDGVKTELEEGEVCVVRGFTGQYEFSFLSKVLQTFEKPFAYALLAYPTQVDARMVRQSMRTKTSWPTRVKLPAAAGIADGETLDVALLDLSLQGAMIEAPTPLGAIGDVIGVQMNVQVDDAPAILKVSARICHNNKSSNSTNHFIGLAFKDATQQDKLLLHYLTQSAQSAKA